MRSIKVVDFLPISSKLQKHYFNICLLGAGVKYFIFIYKTRTYIANRRYVPNWNKLNYSKYFKKYRHIDIGI